MTLQLDGSDRLALSGELGGARQIAMRVVVAMAEAVDAPHLIDIESAHIDGCGYSGQAGLDFAELLVAGGGRVAVPTTLNAGSMDLLRPERWVGDPSIPPRARRVAHLYSEMGCEATWTCAPYQLPVRPSFGAQIAWGESNAISFANSVLGARTGRYGDSFDICAAITGRVAYAGLHVRENRRAQCVYRLVDVTERLMQEDVLFETLGYLVGGTVGSLVPVIVGLPSTTTEDQLKAIGAAAAASGEVALFHVVGVTPEAPTLDAALQGSAPLREVDVTMADLVATRAQLVTDDAGPLNAVSVGTPHFSTAQFELLRSLLRGRRVHPDVDFYISTGRHVLTEVSERGWLADLERAGIIVVTDTCLYHAPLFKFRIGTVMTNSAKWAHYGPETIGVKVAFGSLTECVESAVAGMVTYAYDAWHEA